MDEIPVVGKGVHDDGASDLGQHFVSVTEAVGIARAQAEHSNSALWEPGCRCPGSWHYLARNAEADRCASELRTDDPTVIDDRHDSALVGHRPHLVSRGLAPKQQEQYPLALTSVESMSSCTTLSVGETTPRRRPDGQRDAGLNRSRRGTGPISVRNSTDLGEGDGRARTPFSAGSCLRRREPAERRETPRTRSSGSIDSLGVRAAGLNVNGSSSRERTFLPSFWGQRSVGWEKGTFAWGRYVHVLVRSGRAGDRTLRPAAAPAALGDRRPGRLDLTRAARPAPRGRRNRNRADPHSAQGRRLTQGRMGWSLSQPGARPTPDSII